LGLHSQLVGDFVLRKLYQYSRSKEKTGGGKGEKGGGKETVKNYSPQGGGEIPKRRNWGKRYRDRTSKTS